VSDSTDAFITVSFAAYTAPTEITRGVGSEELCILVGAPSGAKPLDSTITALPANADSSGVIGRMGAFVTASFAAKAAPTQSGTVGPDQIRRGSKRHRTNVVGAA
jgi:hypothetical protein